jgi:hypothetical protein
LIINPLSTPLVNEKQGTAATAHGLDLNRAYMTLIKAYMCCCGQGKLSPAQKSEIEENAL